MKKIFRFLLFLLMLAILAIVAYFVYIKYYAEVGNTDAFSSIPKESIFVVETRNLSDAWTSIENSELWHHLLHTDYFADMNEDIKTVNFFLDSNSITSNLLKNRALIISGVLISPKEWDFLFSVDLGKGKTTVKSLEKILDFIDGYRVSRYKLNINDDSYDVIQLTEIAKPENKIFFSFVDNVLLVSLNGSVIEKSLSEIKDNHWQNDQKFVEIMSLIPERKLFKIYLNYSLLDEFSGIFLTEKDETIEMISHSLAYSILNLDITKDEIILDGYANLDTSGSYLQALAEVNPAKLKAYKIMTNQAAAYISICFDDYNDFYNKLMNEYKKNYPEDAAEIDKYINLLKNVIKIDIDRDLFSWIGSEIAVFKIRPLSINSRAEDVVVAIQAEDINDAENGMTNIVEQIRKWSPFKFKEYSYNGFKINFLKQKGFFKPFLGDITKDLEQPFFTYIEDYVVFSNSEATLKQVIDDYNAGRIIANDEKFMDFIKQFNKKNTFSVFINMPKMYQTLYYFIQPKERKDLKENEQLIQSVARLGFQLVNANGNFRTSLRAQYDSTAYYEDVTEILNISAERGVFTDFIDTAGYMLDLPDDLPDGRYTEYFDGDSTKLKLEGNIVDGKPVGIWRSYYPSGNIFSAVNFLDGYADGVAYFYYDDRANTLRAELTLSQNKADGIYNEYYANGARKAKMIYINGFKQGKAEFYYKTGNLKIEAQYKDNKKNGRWIYYDEKGNKIGMQKWKNGELKREKM